MIFWHKLPGRITMVRRNEDHKQLELFDTGTELPPAVRRRLEDSWAPMFYEHVLCQIDAEPFSVLYSQDAGRPDFPVNIFISLEIISALHEKRSDYTVVGERSMDTIDAYKVLLKEPTFSIDKLVEMTGSQSAAYALSSRLMQKGLVREVRRNIYAIVNLTTEDIIASRYQIACAISDEAYLCLDTAAEYLGLAEAHREQVYVSSETAFKNFRFQGIKYRYASSKIRLGVIESQQEEGVRTTDLERTLLDLVDSPQVVAGLEELVALVDQIPSIEETKLVKYLNAYNHRSLYQKVGFLLSNYQQKLAISADFINMCKEKMKSGTRYFTHQARIAGKYDPEWKLVVPGWLSDMWAGAEQ